MTEKRCGGPVYAIDMTVSPDIMGVWVGPGLMRQHQETPDLTPNPSATQTGKGLAMDSSHSQDDRTPAQWLDIDDDTLRSRISLATEMMLTSGIINAEDVQRGWFDKPEPEEQIQRLVITLGLMVILNGVHGCPADAIVDAWHVTRLLEGAVEAMLTAVEVIRSEGA